MAMRQAILLSRLSPRNPTTFLLTRGKRALMTNNKNNLGVMRQFSSTVSAIQSDSDVSTSVISGNVKVEYAFETARVRVFLPEMGETWFFVDQRTTLKDFKQQCIDEDPRIQNLSFLAQDEQGNIREVKNEESHSLYSALMNPDKRSTAFFIKVNENIH